MTGKIKSEEKQSPKKTNSNFLRNFALMLGLIVAAIVVLVKYNPQLFDSFLKEKSSSTEHTLEQNNKLDKTNSQESYSVGPEPPLLSFSPDEGETDIDDIDDGDLEKEEDMEPETQHPYEIEIENDELAEQNINSSEQQVQFISEINNYRLFLANADRLVTKFRQDEALYNELGVFNSITHPNRIKNILLLLEDYNQMLSNPECEASDKFVDIFSSKPLNKFIKVTKVSKSSEAQKQLKDRINELLPVLINYIYSPELQESFIK